MSIWTAYFTCQALAALMMIILVRSDIVSGKEVSVSLKDIFMVLLVIALGPVSLLFLVMFIFENYGNKPLFKFKAKFKED